MKNKQCFIYAIAFSMVLFGCNQEINVKQGSFTAVNPLSYTDVVYKSNRDTVLVSTFSGRIAEIIKGEKKEHVLINLSDEIYSLAYDPKARYIYASTLHSGILRIDLDNPSAIDSFPIEQNWISKIFLSKDGDVLAGRSADRINYIWDLEKNFRIALPEKLSTFKVEGLDVLGNLVLKGNGKHILWNPKKNTIEKEVTASGSFMDIDEAGNMLFLNDKEFQFYNASLDSISFSKQHPDWPYYVAEQDTVVRIPIQLSLTTGLLADDFIYTAGIDRSIRKWHKLNGENMADIIEHKATVSAIAWSPDHSQIVSVDLKGGICFSAITD